MAAFAGTDVTGLMHERFDEVLTPRRRTSAQPAARADAQAGRARGPGVRVGPAGADVRAAARLRAPAGGSGAGSLRARRACAADPGCCFAGSGASASGDRRAGDLLPLRRQLNELDPEPAQEAGDRKATAVAATGADVLVTASPGCPVQIASAMRRSGGAVDLAHTAEILDASIRGAAYRRNPEPRVPTHQGG
jgi:hypothetical protein